MQPSEDQKKRLEQAANRIFAALTPQKVDVCEVLEKLADKAEKKPFIMKMQLHFVDKI